MDVLQDSIAVVGIACRFPGAKNKYEFWQNLLSKKETVKHFTDEEMEAFELEFDKLRNNPSFVKAKGVLADVDKWDASFFNMLPAEAKIMDPQQRIWLQNTWHAFEDAGLDPYSYKGNIGVFAGSFYNTYLLNNVLRNPLNYEQYMRGRTPEMFQAYINSDPMFLATKTAYMFNLRGPAISVQTACSTSLVAVAQACSSLLTFESDVCVAGGVTVTVPQETGYIYQEGAIASPDGHCRPFDKDSKGTVFGNGVGTVILKRLQDAIDDNDRIYSIIRGWSTNNDGNQKIGFAAPGIDGQASAISAAHNFADITADKISYVEAHGTATPLGDPIEVTALTKAFRQTTDKNQFCALGSVKSNIGHLDAAAGVAGLIKISLSAYYKKVPATLHYKEPNPRINFNETPFYVINENKDFTDTDELFLGVSSFGVGGTNAHVLISSFQQESKNIDFTQPLLMINSARSKVVLQSKNEQLEEYIKKSNEQELISAAYTLQLRRNHMVQRSFAILNNAASNESVSFISAKNPATSKELVFMYPGQGAQFVSMGKELYEKEAVFRKEADLCFSYYKDITGEDLKELLFAESNAETDKKLAQTKYTQPALFIVEYCTAMLYMTYGIYPDYQIGHSIGEYTAACISGVFDLQTAIKIVVKRGELMQTMPEGNMMAVTTDADNLIALQSDLFEIAADNSHAVCTISYDASKEDEIRSMLEAKDLKCIPLNTSHAFHSKAFEPILKEFSQFVDALPKNAPQIPFISCLNGDFIKDEDAMSGEYWAKQLRNTVKFKNGVTEIAEYDDIVFIEVGPNTHLAGMITQNSNIEDKQSVVASLGKKSDVHEQVKFFKSIGELWIRGVEIDFNTFYKTTPSLTDVPLYPFEQKRYWLDFKLNEANVDLHTDTKVVTDNEGADSVLKESVDESISGQIIHLWKEIFELDDITIDDDFIQLGGHSLLAIQILTRIKEQYGSEIILREFLNNPTIKYLVEEIEKVTQNKQAKKEDKTFVHLSGETDLPITDTQKRLYFIAQLNNESPAYNIPFTLKLSGIVDKELLRKAIEISLSRHKMVHANFVSKNNDVVCIINEREVILNYENISSLGEQEKKEKLELIIGQQSRKVFDLATDALYRFILIQTETEEYYFHATINHIVFDGISIGIFINELNEIYNKLLKDEPYELPAIEYQQYDYAHWEKNRDESESINNSKKFWKENLDGISPLVNFPVDRQRQKTPSGYGKKLRISLPNALKSRISELSKKENITVFHFMLSAFSLLIQKYSNEEDFCIGSPISHRPHRHLESLLGMFVNTITFRYNYENIKTFKELLHFTKEMSLDAISHQDLSFDKVVEIVQPDRHTLYNPIFQIAFSWQSFVADPLSNENLTSSFATIPDGIAPFDLTFYLWEEKQTIEGEIEFNIDVLDSSTVENLRDNFLVLLDALTADVSINLGKVSLLNEKEKQLILEWNNTNIEYENAICIHQKFEKQAEHTPNQTAIIWNDVKISYKDFNIHANRLAHYLISKGVEPDNLVAVCIERCPEMMVAIYAILKAGGAYLPIDSALPTDRIRTIVDDADVKIILTINRSSTNLPKDTNAEFVYLDSILKEPISEKTENPVTKVHSHNLAYVIYTSGSTGVPKGVMIEHHSVLNRIGWMQAEYPIHTDDVLIQKTPISFDVSVWELFWWGFEGAGLNILAPGAEKDPEQIIDEIKRNSVSIMHFVPSMFGAFISYIESSGRMSELATLRNIFLSGEAFPPGMVNDFYSTMKDHNSPFLINLYGPTEATVDVSHYPLPKTTSLETMYIGKTIQNTKLLVINEHRQILPIGVPGELVITGVNLSRGYLKRDDLNAEKFIDLEYVDGTTIRAYRTGDLVKQTKTGDIFYIGRIDNQVKLRGFRIELGEIESLLTEYNDISEAVVLATDVGKGMQQLVAFVKRDDAAAFSETDAKNYLASKLPNYMVPDIVVAMEEFPLSPNGKINRKKLVEQIKEQIKKQEPVTNTSVKRDLTKTEKIISDIWKDVLKTENFTVTDSFFDVGGNSILAITIVEIVKKQCNVDIKLRAFFESPTIDKFAQQVDVLLSLQNVSFVGEEQTSGRIISGEI